MSYKGTASSPPRVSLVVSALVMSVAGMPQRGKLRSWFCNATGVAGLCRGLDELNISFGAALGNLFDGDWGQGGEALYENRA